MRHQTSSTSTGFVIEGRRILTNAHCVENFAVVKVKKRASSTKHIAEVIAIGRECDLALLTVTDNAFWDEVTPIRLANALPSLQEVFLRNLGRDYERWVGDAGYRETRARMKVAAFEE